MLTKVNRLRCIAVSACALAAVPALAQTPVGTAFTYQGRLTDNGAVASGSYDFRLTLYDAATGGAPVGSVVTREDVAVNSGLFEVSVDFGASAFTGSARWLEVGVRPGASTGSYTVLDPRQELTPSPMALYSGTTPWTGVSGKPAGFADDLDNDVLGGLSCASGQVAKWNGSWACAADADSGGTVTSVSASTPLSSSGGATPNLTLSGTVPVASGGTGTGSTLSGVLLGGNPFSSLSASSGSQLLRRNAANSLYEFTTPSGGGDPVGSSRSLSTGPTLQGGGDLSANRTLDLNLGNFNAWTAQQRFAPTSDVAGVLVRQTSAASPTADVFRVENTAGSTSFLRVGSSGAVTWSGTASGDISGNAGSATNFSGSLSGDVTGTQAATTVAGLRGRTVSATAPTTDQVLKWSGSTWAPGADSNSGGTVSQVATGTGLTGGPITSSGTVAVATGGITSGLLADGAVSSAKIANGAVGLAQINTAEVQPRIGGSCPPGHYLRGINPDGSVVCEPVPLTPWVPTVLATVDSGGFVPSIAIGTDGLPIISYYDDGASALKVAHCGNAACSLGNTITAVDDPTTSDVGDFSSIVIGADGLPIISYLDETAGALKVAHCGNAACTAGNTLTTVDDQPVNGVGYFTSIAIGSDGLPVISYYGISSGNLKVAHCGNAACSSGNTLTVVDSFGGYTSIAIGTDGLPVISYGGSVGVFGDGTLKVAHCGNAACSAGNTLTTVDDTTSDVGYFTSIAIGPDGFPIISYLDLTAGALKVAHCGDAACSAGNTLTTVDEQPVNLVGAGTSIAIGSDGLPVVSYYGYTANLLKVAHCGNPACSAGSTLAVVDSASQGLFEDSTSIAIGTDGLPVISYVDANAGTLRVAKCGTRTCQ